MNTNVLKIFIITIIALSMLLLGFETSQAADKKKIMFIYASWSVVCRDLRPVAANVAASLNVPYEEYDIDSQNTHDLLQKLNIQIPTDTPNVLIFNADKVVFNKTYNNSTPDILRKDLLQNISK